MISKKFFIHQGFYLTLYAFYQLIRFTKTIAPPFATRLAEQDFSFVMSSKEAKTARYYQIRNGKLTSRTNYQPTDFGLIWLDEKTGCLVMMSLMRGKRHALKNAIMKGELILEGEAALIGNLLGIMNQLALVYRNKGPEKQTNN